MSDKDLIASLWREAAYVKPLSNGAYEALTDAAEALEARQPSEDASGAISAVLNRLDELNNGGISYEVYSELHDLVSAIPDAVPDAATAESERRAWAIAGHLELDREAVKAERDAALAAIERVKETLSLHNPNGRLVKEVLAALDGAPEPERKKQLERVSARLREIVYLCSDDLGCQCEEANYASADLARELGIIAAERPTLTADEVWAIARAEHDYANDSDNVGAFVGSLTDALRTAGVAFDEQPFIDSGYLLPVEGEKP